MVSGVEDDGWLSLNNELDENKIKQNIFILKSAWIYVASNVFKELSKWL